MRRRELPRRNLRSRGQGEAGHEIEYAKHASLLNAMRISACFGDADEYISVSDAQKLEGLLKGAGINLSTNFYKGEHRIYDDLLKKVIDSHEAQ